MKVVAHMKKMNKQNIAMNPSKNSKMKQNYILKLLILNKNSTPVKNHT